ncbi:hypothetical protein SAMN05444358_11727 [Ruegeria halocynthiae]|uniref:Uncharacterized protein n=1 Tax=Ruegeria halocynthiae TaxID=985054 RepID=A0A1H3FTN0_9RHOB|nr:DUF6331 family protein [Ruegeria halocynthiae]SDX93499.1 hypothetical protein SAMN05444358_11727 [Ruegeria halocynthiae]
MIEIQLPPAFAALCKTCETICEKECCGIGAFNFSPFNIIYHLTKWEARIRDSDVEMLRSELTDLAANIRSSHQRSEKLVLSELNAILTNEQVLALIREVESALTDGYVIYSSQEIPITERYEKFLRIVKVP